MGLFDIFGKVAKLGGTAATLAGHPEVGIPLAVAGGASQGASQGGVQGALAGGLSSGVSAAVPTIVKGAMPPPAPGPAGPTILSSSGSPMTVPLPKSTGTMGGS